MMGHSRSIIFPAPALVALALAATCGLAHAQTPPQAPSAPPQTVDPQTVNPNRCSDPATQTRRDTTPGTEGRGPAGQTLSEQLNNSDGVLCPPPEVDPGIKAPTPDVG